MEQEHLQRCREKVKAFHNQLVDKEAELIQAEKDSMSYWLKLKKWIPFANTKQSLPSIEVERKSSLLVENVFDLAKDCDQLSKGDFQKVRQEIWLLAQREERRENITEEEIFENEGFCEQWMRWNTTRLRDMMLNYSKALVRYEEMSLAKRSV